MKQRFGRKDIIFILVLFFLGVVSWLYVRFFVAKTGETVRITVDSQEYGCYPLKADKTIPVRIDGEIKNIVQIRDGKASMKEANCPDKLCVHQNAISAANESIICLPHKVVVSIVGEADTPYDTIAQ